MRIEIKESVIYDGMRQGLVEWEGQNQPEIELNDASDKSPGESSALPLHWPAVQQCMGRTDCSFNRNISDTSPNISEVRCLGDVFSSSDG
jgi:hypothetical protein